MTAPSSYTYGKPSNIMAILNANVVREEEIKASILTMGMAACQTRCLSCQCCSRCHGNHKH